MIENQSNDGTGFVYGASQPVRTSKYNSNLWNKVSRLRKVYMEKLDFLSMFLNFSRFLALSKNAIS